VLNGLQKETKRDKKRQKETKRGAMFYLIYSLHAPQALLSEII